LKKISWFTAAALVVSNMIGTGVFTSLGYQVAFLNNTITILLLWALGGLLALLGTFCYAELGNYYKESGGDYIFLSRAFHPILGYLTSWISLVVGFSAPVSLAALAMSKYLQIFGWDLGSGFAIWVIVLVAITQSISLKSSSNFQNIFTVIKVLFVLVLIILGLTMASQGESSLHWDGSWISEIQHPSFAFSLVFVSFAYTGWNSASYIVSEIKNPKKNLSKALILGTLFVTTVYILLNFVFLKHASIAVLSNQEDVASIAAQNFLGSTGAKWVCFFISAQLIATISGYLWIGSRICYATSKEHKLWSFMNKSRNETPYIAVWVQALIAILIIASGGFAQIFIYASFVLQFISVIAIAAVFRIPAKKRLLFKGNYFYIFPVVYIVFGVYICIFTFIQHPVESLFGLSTILTGLILYFFDREKAVA
jgi:basic amino acid/polyamine antiporter, APA family